MLPSSGCETCIGFLSASTIFGGILACHPEDCVSLSVSEARVHSSLQVFSVQLAYPVSPFLDREQFVCPRVHEIGEGDRGDGGGKIESRCTGGAQIESWIQPWRFPRYMCHSVLIVQVLGYA